MLMTRSCSCRWQQDSPRAAVRGPPLGGASAAGAPTCAPCAPPPPCSAPRFDCPGSAGCPCWRRWRAARVRAGANCHKLRRPGERLRATLASQLMLGSVWNVGRECKPCGAVAQLSSRRLHSWPPCWALMGARTQLHRPARHPEACGNAVGTRHSPAHYGIAEPSLYPRPTPRQVAAAPCECRRRFRITF